MTSFLQLILLLAIIILVAKLAGYLSTRLGQPSVFGELMVGLILGPSLLDITHLSFITNTHIEETIIEFGEIGVLFLMFLAGLELEIRDLARNTRVSALAGVLGVVVPAGMGYLIGILFKMPSDQAIFLGLTLGATSVSISAQTLMELKVLRSRVGLGLLGAAVFDDILVILLLSTFTALVSGASGAGRRWFNDTQDGVIPRPVCIDRFVRFTVDVAPIFEIADQPGQRGVGDCRHALLRRGSGSRRRYGGYHRYLCCRPDAGSYLGEEHH